MAQQDKASYKAQNNSLFADNTTENISEADVRAQFEDSADTFAILNEVNTFTKQQRWKKGVDIASGSTLTPGTDGNIFNVTGSGTITSIADMGGSGTVIILRILATPTFTHHSSDLILPGGANITASAGDVFIFSNYASGDWDCIGYKLASGGAIFGLTEIVQDLTPQLADDLDAQSNKITNLASPTSNDHAVNKSYVDGLVDGLKYKSDRITVATTGNITLSGEQTIDGVLTSSSRVLVWQQTDQTENGIYVSASGSWSRSSDGDTGSELISAVVIIGEGSTYAETEFVCTNDSITLGSTNITWVQKSAGGDVSKVGTPANNELAVWTGDGTLEGEPNIVVSNGHIGFHNTSDIESWWSNYKVFEGPYSAIAFQTNSPGLLLCFNAYFNGTNWKYKSTSETGRLFYSGGDLAYYAAASGTENDNITYNQIFRAYHENNFEFFGANDDFGATTPGEGCLRINDVTTIPVGTMSNGGLLYVSGASLYFHDDAGNATDLTAGTGNMTDTNTVYETDWIPAGAMAPSETNGAEIGTRKLATNDVQIDYLAFDKDTDEYCQFNHCFEEQITSDPTVRFKFKFTAAAGSGNVVWGMQYIIVSDNDALDASWSTASTAGAKTLSTTNDYHDTDGACNLTLTGLTDGDLVLFRVFRDTSADSLSDDAQLIGVNIQYPRNNTAGTVWS